MFSGRRSRMIVKEKKNAFVVNRKVCYTEASLPSTKHFKKQEISLHQEHMANPKSASILHDVQNCNEQYLTLVSLCKLKSHEGKENKAEITRQPAQWQWDSKNNQAMTAPSSVQSSCSAATCSASLPNNKHHTSRSYWKGRTSVTRRLHSDTWKNGTTISRLFCCFGGFF